jgi:segregation and condensation protein B
MSEPVRLAEALLFASAEPVGARALGQILPDGADVDAVLAELRALYAGRGVELVEVAGGWQFRTAPDLAERLRIVVPVPRRLPRAAMEVLAIIAYHQPVTRPEIEQMRGASLAQATLDQLLSEGLVTPAGRREVPGRPTLWATTPAFLSRFGLRDLRDLPKRDDLLVESPPIDQAGSAEAVAVAEDRPVSP